MNKIKLIFLFALLFNMVNTQAQTPITDTLQYLQDSVIANKSNFVGKPLDSLLNKIRLDIVQSNDGLMPFAYLPDTLYCPGIALFFDDKEFSYETLIKLGERGQGSPPKNFHIKSLIVTFTTPVPVLKSALDYGNYLSGWWWSPAKKAFWGQYIVADLVASEQ